jgi:hypothetical protein
VAARNLPAFVAKAVSDAGLEFLQQESSNSSSSSGGHNLLRTLADKNQMRAWNNINLPGKSIVDVGSKFVVVDRLL